MFENLFGAGSAEQNLMNFLLNPKIYKIIDNIGKISDEFIKNNGFVVKTKCSKCGHEFSINVANEKGEYSSQIFECPKCKSYIEFKAMIRETDKKVIILAKAYDFAQETDLQENLNKYLFENMSKEDINTIIKYAKENNMDENEINNFIEMLTKYGIELEENNDDIHE